MTNFMASKLTIDAAFHELEAVRRKADKMYEGKSTGVTEIVAYSNYALGIAILTAAQLVSQAITWSERQTMESKSIGGDLDS